MYNLIREKLKNKDKILIGISGISLSGKTTFAKEIQNKLENDNYKVQVISLVENENIIKASFNYKNPSKYYYENAFNFNKVKEQIDECFKSNDIVIVEGLLLFKNTVKINFNVKVWIDCTFTTSINRAPMDKKNLCEDFYMWLHRQHFSIDNPKKEVDIVIKNDEILENEPEIFVDLKNKPSSVKKMQWLNEPTIWEVRKNEVYVETDAITDFWQRTHYGFRNDNAHMLYIETEKDFVMTTKVKFNAIHQFDQCGLIVRIDEDNWLKTSIEYELGNPPKLGGVVTNLGYSDWSTEELDFQVNEAKFRITREDKDYKIEVNVADRGWRQLRICHLHSTEKKVKCGIYCCSPIDNGYEVSLKDLKIQEQYF
ncbi:DUF1349 domain-containing protein [Clostridium ganghwense]|uniref:DUF1349 domain-containing protein n=1 Tax=Clostridium ganghwense TaxID=312089 RepID=A0ABT4CUB3_9CLOT|nr:DUF1349 domain-containing protein [Clostridium ganghwense]MCY6372622.1 DUF1349 domain-containing protein [Clostridium ganghwense]